LVGLIILIYLLIYLDLILLIYLKLCMQYTYLFNSTSFQSWMVPPSWQSQVKLRWPYCSRAQNFFPSNFKHYNLTIYVGIEAKIFSKNSNSTLAWICAIESLKKSFYISIMLNALKSSTFGYFLKNTSSSLEIRCKILWK